MERRPYILLLAIVMLVFGSVVHADKADKAECKRGCEEALQGCKSDCRNERDSGTQQQSGLYTDCDSGCHDTYQSCKSDCESD